MNNSVDSKDAVLVSKKFIHILTQGLTTLLDLPGIDYEQSVSKVDVISNTKYKINYRINIPERGHSLDQVYTNLVDLFDISKYKNQIQTLNIALKITDDGKSYDINYILLQPLKLHVLLDTLYTDKGEEIKIETSHIAPQLNISFSPVVKYKNQWYYPQLFYIIYDKIEEKITKVVIDHYKVNPIHNIIKNDLMSTLMPYPGIFTFVSALINDPSILIYGYRNQNTRDTYDMLLLAIFNIPELFIQWDDLTFSWSVSFSLRSL